MAKIDIISGFLGAGKTTLIKKLIQDAFKSERVVLIENEFGEIGIDGGFLKEAGIEITEMNSGCICCSLVGDFGEALKKVVTEYTPDRVIIEPSGVGKLSDVIKAVEKASSDVDIKLNSATTVVDVTKAKMYIKNFGEFFLNQIEACGTVVLSRSQNASDEKLLEVVNMINEHKKDARIFTTPWDQIDGTIIL
ncbi:MAG: cobalamin biosynthesis protein CobW, partial [Eubacterium sp.]|nr:cobalamin biosynthesis protein CobW [Eubacterium sp.]